MYHKIIELIKQEVKPALGCTEPIAVALAVAKSVESLGQKPEKISVEVSANILKNGMGVGIPGTGMTGLYIAIALGAICGKSEYKLEVLKDAKAEDVSKAKEMVEQGRIEITLADTPEKLYIKAFSTSGTNSGEAIIATSHDRIISASTNGTEYFKLGASDSSTNTQDSSAATLDPDFARKITVKQIYDFALNADFNDIKFVLDCVKLNMALVEEGLSKDSGLMVGKTINNNNNTSIFGDSLMSYAMAATAAASDARMSGSMLPAMSNSGSGNQGITVTVPVIAAAKKLGASEETLARALTISHLVAIHIKGYLGKLSALCGCVIASTGSSCGIIYLNSGSYEQMCYAIKNMVGNLTGMVCDGAKVGCALKVATGVSSAVQSAALALNNICISSNDGIIDDDVEKTIENLGKVGSLGMQKTDELILDIMVNG